MINTAKPLTLGNHSTQEQVECQYKSSHEKHDRERLLAVSMAYEKNSLKFISSTLKRGRATIARWIKAYKEGGTKQLLKRLHRGRKASLSQPIQLKLIEKLISGKYKTAKEIQTWLKTDCGVSLKLNAIYYWLGYTRASWILPRPEHEKGDPEAKENFKREILSRLESLSIPIGRNVHIWVEDEHRYGLMKVIRRCWTLKGHRPKVSHNDRYEWGYIYGAVDIVTGKAEFIYSPTVTLEWSKEFLKQLVSTDPEAIHIVLWDNAGFHPEKLEGELSESVRFVPFPAYSPELNPIEPLWNQVKQEIGNIVWSTLEDMETGIDKVLKPFWADVKRVWSLLGNTWLTRGVITFLRNRIDQLFLLNPSDYQLHTGYG
jgi:transposase